MDDNILFFVFSNPTEGREAEYNDWYDNVHVPEVLATPGMESARRYVLSDAEVAKAGGEQPAHRYLCVYEMKGDPDAVMASVGEAVASGAMHMSDALDLATSKMMFWSPRGPKVEA